MEKYSNLESGRVGNGPGRVCESDAAFIEGLKRNDNGVCRQFFYGEIGGILHRIRMELFRGLVAFDELVGELYLHLSRDGWRKLDGFDGKGGCRLRTWMIPVAWRYFMSIRGRLACGGGGVSSGDGDGDAPGAASIADDLRIQIAIDVNAVLARMPNRRYAEILRLLLIEGFEAQEVADMLDMRVANVYNLKHRAIRQFVDLYGRR